MQKLEIPKPVTWSFLKETCLANLDSLYYERIDQAEEGLYELEQQMNIYVPWMTVTPWVVNVNDWETAFKNLRKVRRGYNKDKKVSILCRDAYFRIVCILNDLSDIDYELHEPANSDALGTLQVLAGLYKWLGRKKWQNIQIPFGFNAREQITATKNKKTMIVLPIGTCNTTYDNFERSMGEIMVDLFNIKIKNPAIQIALAVAGDKKTRSVFMPYTPFILKTGIRIFLVTGPDEALEIKK